jgi:hypothetical protein
MQFDVIVRAVFLSQSMVPYMGDGIYPAWWHARESMIRLMRPHSFQSTLVLTLSTALLKLP